MFNAALFFEFEFSDRNALSFLSLNAFSMVQLFDQVSRVAVEAVLLAAGLGSGLNRGMLLLVAAGLLLARRGGLGLRGWDFVSTKLYLWLLVLGQKLPCLRHYFKDGVPLEPG